MLRYLLMIAIGWLTLGGAVYAQSTVTIGDAAAPLGGTANVPITVTGDGTATAAAIRIAIVDANGAPAGDLFSSVTPDAVCSGFTFCQAVDANTFGVGIAGTNPIGTINFSLGYALIAAPDEARFPVTFQVASPPTENPPSINPANTGSISISAASCTLTGTIPDTLSGSTSAPASIVLTNTTDPNAPVDLDIINAALATGTNFAIAANGCTAPLATGATCNIDVTFSPNAIANFTDTLNVTGTAACSLALSANGLDVLPVGPFPSVTPNALSFGTDAGTQTITVTNNDNAGPGEGTVDLAFTSIPDATGLDSTDGSFTFVGTTCPAALAAGTSCTIDIAFDPAADGDPNNTSNGSYTVSFASSPNVIVSLIGGTTPIPTLSEWAMIIMASLMLMLGVVTLRRNDYFK
jgi:hypothetical protein